MVLQWCHCKISPTLRCRHLLVLIFTCKSWLRYSRERALQNKPGLVCFVIELRWPSAGSAAAGGASAAQKSSTEAAPPGAASAAGASAGGVSMRKLKYVNQTLTDSFLAVSKPKFASKYSLESS